MSRHSPAIDTAIAPQHGLSRDGQPLSYNRAPSADLSPWISRLYVTRVVMPADYTLQCSLFNDTACLRIQLAGDWSAETADGVLRARAAAVRFFGPQSRRMPVSVTGSFTSLGFAIRPGACHAVHNLRVADYVDRCVDPAVIGMSSASLVRAFDPEASPEDWLNVLEDNLRKAVCERLQTMPDPLSTRFEEFTLRSPALSVAEIARLCDVDRRRLERIVHRDFGMSPKQVLRRARALDMASVLRGVADREEAEEMALRFYDESHLIHEFMALFDMSPKQFEASAQPLLTLSLEARQARRLETLKRLNPGEVRPWA